MKLKVNLKNCYGISSIDKEFDFSKKKVFSVYASNGVMKTSFAKTFIDLSKNNDSKDEIYLDRKTIRSLKKDGNELKGDEVFVIKPYDEKYKSDNISTLLVNQTLKGDFDRAYDVIKQKKYDFLKVIEELSKLKPEDIEEEICAIFHQGDEGKFFESLVRIEGEVLDEKEGLYKDIQYNELFNDKTKQVISDESFLNNINNYVVKYNELLEKSNFFKKGIFNHIQASDVAMQLNKNGFFEAEHSIVLKGKDKKITTKNDLEEVITNEKDQILEDEELKKEFNKLDKILKKNQNLQKFREYLSNNPQIVSELSNPESFKAKLWISYFKKNKETFKELVLQFNKSKDTIEHIRTEAGKEKGVWHTVIDDFNNKFFVPFTLNVDNQADVILNGTLPKVKFKFNGIDIEENKLLEVLSQGEKRALYILNILFEVKVREGKECLFIVDDIADSFDYKNKYAIIEYLKEISEKDNFYLIILTHNFDFHRSVCSRLDTSRENKLNAIKTDSGIILEEEVYQNDPLNHWRDNLDNSEMLFASIPMARNLFKYSGRSDEEKELTNFLHIKEDTKTLTIGSLKDIYKELFGGEVDKIKDLEGNFYNSLIEKCDSINDEKLENKIILSIAIRLKAEEFVISKINNQEGITGNQTFKLFKEYKEQYPCECESIKILERVNLMTPENIHLNSFMYEPILDMSADELKKLYNDVKTISMSTVN